MTKPDLIELSRPSAIRRATATCATSVTTAASGTPARPSAPLKGPTMPDLIELRLLLEEATPGPWEFDSLGEDEPEVNAWTHRFIGNTTPDENGHYQIIATTEDGHGPNAQLIVAAVNALPDLLDAAEALERVKAFCAMWQDRIGRSPCGCDYRRGHECSSEAMTARLRRVIDGEPQP